jgi:Ca2+-transporting ATPase
MSVVSAYIYGRHYEDVEKMRAQLNNPGAAHRLAKAIALNSTAELRLTGPRVEFVRNPSECALLLMLWREFDVDYVAEREAAGRPLHRRPFKKETKYMTTVCAPEAKGEGPIVYVKGAPEAVLDMCTHTQAANGKLTAIEAEIRFILKEQVREKHYSYRD